MTRTLPLDRAIGCVVYCSTELEGPGLVRHLEGTRFSIGEPGGGSTDRCLEFSEAMIAGGLKCPVEEDIRNDIWIKLLGNAAFNPISALARATMVEIAQHSGTRAMVRLMMEETLEIAAAVGCQPDISVDKRIDGAERVGEHKTSMLQDLEKDKPLELDVILAAVVELADLTGTQAPTLRAVHAVADLLSTKVGPAPRPRPQRRQPRPRGSLPAVGPSTTSPAARSVRTRVPCRPRNRTHCPAPRPAPIRAARRRYPRRARGIGRGARESRRADNGVVPAQMRGITPRGGVTPLF